jgi:lactoylglutathione lyase
MSLAGLTHPINIEVRVKNFLLCLTLAFVLLPVSRSAEEGVSRPKILGIAHAAFYVSDLEKTRTFYKDFLGYTEPFALKNADQTADRIAFIKINDKQYIELFNEKPRAVQQLNHISFYTEDAQKMRDYLVSKGVKVPEKVGKGKTGNFNYNVVDPDGNIVEIVEYLADSWTGQNMES